MSVDEFVAPVLSVGPLDEVASVYVEVEAVGVVDGAPGRGGVVVYVALGHGVAHLFYLASGEGGVDVGVAQLAVVAVDFFSAEAVAGVGYDTAVEVADSEVVPVVEVCVGVGVDAEAPAVVVVGEAGACVGIGTGRRVFHVDGEEVWCELFD